MARIRTIKPEFWTDDLIGSLKREHRLLFIASWNLADDEGLLRWSAPYLKGAVFPFDDDISVKDVEKSMAALEAAGIIFAYAGGRSQQKLAYIVNFHKHQKINRPSPSRLPPPSLQIVNVRMMYAARDGFVCHLCDGKIDQAGDEYGDDFAVAIDHLQPTSLNGNDFPSNLRASHQTCNKGRGSRSVEEYRALVMSGKTASQARFPARFSHISLSNSLSDSHTELERDLGDGPRTLERTKDLPARASARPALVWPFEQFWAQYPHKIGKQDAVKAFAKAERDGTTTLENLMLGLLRYAAKTDDRAWCNPATWLNGRRWDDQPAATPCSSNGGQRGKQSLSDLAFELADQARAREHAAGIYRPPDDLGSG